jgi:macrolide transport system ATP-binding/permease protein
MNAILRKLRWLVARRRRENEFEEELAFHLEEEAEERGYDAARRDLGNLGLIKEDTRHMWGWTWVEQLRQDLRYAVRTMLKNLAFTAMATLSLALGIGANTAIFSFMDALMLRSLPVGHPERLVTLNWHASIDRMRGSVLHSGSGSAWKDGDGMSSGMFPYPAFDVLRQTGVLSNLFGYFSMRSANFYARGQAEPTTGELVTGGYFRGLELPPAAGRFLAEDDDRAGAAPVVVLGFNLAQRRFGDVASAIGESVLINNRSYTVAGVAPPGFSGLEPAESPDLYIPLHVGEEARSFHDEHYYWLLISARLRPGTTMAEAQAQVAPVFHRWVDSTAANDQERAHLPELVLASGAKGLDTLRREYSKPMFVLLTMVGLILAIACANIANLLLGRATARRREMAVRLSIGAGRWRVIRQLLTESVLLASIGGAAGILIAIWGVRSLTLLLSSGAIPLTLKPDLNWHVLAVAVALSMLTGLLFGLAPAYQATRVDVMTALKEVRANDRLRRVTLSHVLVVGQIALSLLLVLAAGLFVRTLSKLESVQLGFNRENVLLFKLDAAQAGHKAPGIFSFYRDLQTRFGSIPGVRSASVAQTPLVAEGSWFTPVTPVGKQPAPDQVTRVLTVGPEYLATMKIPLIAGREIDDRDFARSSAVAVVNEKYVKVNFDGRMPLGEHIAIERRAGKPPLELEIVGVTRDFRYGDLKEELPAIAFVPFNQLPFGRIGEMTYSIRTAGDPLAVVAAVREIVRQADARVPVTHIKTQATMVEQTMTREILFARLCSGFAILALAIACVGLYGTMSYAVARRTGEIGIRMALGAPRGRVVWMVMRQVAIMGAIGLAIGLPAAWAASRLVKSFLYGIEADDPSSIAAAIVTMAIAVIVAGYAPARRASRIDPAIALRSE